MKTGLCPDMPFMVNDWLSSTAVACMTPAQEGGFLRLLLHAWNDPDCTVPDDDKALATLSRLGKEWDRGSGRVIRSMFLPDLARGGRLFNAKQRAVREIQARRIGATREQRTAAVKARWAKRDALREQSGNDTAVLRENVRRGVRGDTSSPVSLPPIPPTTQNAGASGHGQGPDMKALLAAELAAEFRTQEGSP